MTVIKSWTVYSVEMLDDAWAVVKTLWTAEEGPQVGHAVAHLVNMPREEAERHAASLQQSYDRVRDIALASL